MTCPVVNVTLPPAGIGIGNGSGIVCTSNQSLLQGRHRWLFSPGWLNPLLCLGTQEFCEETQQRNCHFASSLLPYSTLFCVFNALNIVNNALSFVIFRKQERGAALTQRIVVLLLKSLSLIEIFFHFFFLLYHITEYCLFSSAISFPGLGPSIFFCLAVNLLIVLQTCFHIARNWIIVIISTFRYEAVCRAMKPVKVFTSVARVHAIIVTVVIASFLISLPRVIYYSCVACDRGAGIYSLDSLELRLRRKHYSAFKVVYQIGALLVFQTGGPILTVCIFSCCIIFGLRRHRKLKQALKKQQTNSTTNSSVGTQPQQQQSAAEQQASRGNLLVIVLCITFLVLEFPLFVSKILEDRITDRHIDAIVVHMSKFATLFDSFINIFIYSISNRKFRQDLSRLVKLDRLTELCARFARRPATNQVESRCNCSSPNLPISNPTIDPLYNSSYRICLYEYNSTTSSISNNSKCMTRVEQEAFKQCRTNCKQDCDEYFYQTSLSVSMWPSDSYETDSRRQIMSYSESIRRAVNALQPQERQSFMSKNFVKIIIFYDDSVMYSSVSNPAYQIIDVLSDMGGQVGLWLGLSVLTLFEIMEMFIDLLFLCTHRALHRSRKPSALQSKGGGEAPGRQQLKKGGTDGTVGANLKMQPQRSGAGWYDMPIVEN